MLEAGPLLTRVFDEVDPVCASVAHDEPHCSVTDNCNR